MAAIEKKVTRSTIVGYGCDNCGKIEDCMSSISVQHFDWGNDSCDSIQSRYYCSSECCKELIMTTLKDSNYVDRKSSVINDIGFAVWRSLLTLD